MTNSSATPSPAATLALTVWQPFAGLLVAGIKPVENRTWAPGGRIRPGDRFMIHAGSRYDYDSWAWCIDLKKRLGPIGGWPRLREPTWPLSAVKPNPDADPLGITPYSAIVGVVTLDEVRREPRGFDPFWVGPVGWYVRDAVPIEPVGCVGFQGLWRPSPAVAAEVNARVDAVLAAEIATQSEVLRRGNIRCFTCGAQAIGGGLDARGGAVIRCENNCPVVIKGLDGNT